LTHGLDSLLKVVSRRLARFDLVEQPLDVICENMFYQRLTHIASHNAVKGVVQRQEKVS